MAEPTAPENRFAFSATRANFQQLVIENSRKGPVLVDFWAPWAGPSLRQGELLRRLAAEYGGRFLLVSVDTDREKAIAEELGVKGLPSCRLFRHGQVVEEVHGMQTEADYRALIERHCLALADRVQAAALAALGARRSGQGHPGPGRGGHGRARATRAPAPAGQAADPGRAPRGRLRGARRPALRAAPGGRPSRGCTPTWGSWPRPSMAPAPRRRSSAALATGPGRARPRLARAARALVADDYDQALAELAEIDRRDPGFRDGIGRRGLIAVLEQLGPDDTRAGTYRRLLFQH